MKICRLIKEVVHVKRISHPTDHVLLVPVMLCMIEQKIIGMLHTSIFQLLVINDIWIM